jgi:cell division protein ZapA
MEPKSIRVRIYGTEYPLKVDDEQLTYKAAQHIDRMMSDLHSQIPDQPPVTLAVLSALNVSEELFHAQKSTNEDLRAAEQEIRALTRFMDETLAQ